MPTIRRLTILMPVYNDWDAARSVVEDLDRVLENSAGQVDVVLVDDGSDQPPAEDFSRIPLHRIKSVEILPLRRNLGHQRAIAIGLCGLHLREETEAVVVMDADGQDRPADVPRLIEQFEKSNLRNVVFAARTRRAEGVVFRLGYHSYRVLHWLLTGIVVRIGNFSILHRKHLAALMVAPDLWNHYAAAVLKTKLPHETVALERAARRVGRSHLNLTAMVVHGLSAISVFIELVTVRLLVAMAVLLGLVVAGFLSLLIAQLVTSVAIPALMLYAGGLLALFVLQLLTAALGLTLLILFNRNSLSFLPIRDWRYFVREPAAPNRDGHDHSISRE